MSRLIRNIGMLSAVAALAVGIAPLEASSPKPPAKPAEISISVAPSTVAAGGQARVTMQIEPIEGVKLNRYPKIKLVVPEREGLVGESRVEVGNSTPPPPDRMATNYFETVEPLEMMLDLDDAAPQGRHDIEGKLTYFYCMPASGFCAPKKVAVKIPVTVR